MAEPIKKTETWGRKQQTNVFEQLETHEDTKAPQEEKWSFGKKEKKEEKEEEK